MNQQTTTALPSTNVARNADQTCDYRVRLADKYDPKGPDGKGWNRIAIFGLSPIDRCILLPTTRQAALDTLRGMARHGSITSYDDCKSGRSPCHACPVATTERGSWNVGWHIREDGRGIVWLLGSVERAFAGRGYAYRNWAALMAAVDVPMLQRKQDSTGFYWIAA